MNILKDKLFADDVKWLAQAYGSLDTAILVEEYFSTYFKDRRKNGEDPRFYLESVDVEFVDPEDVPRMTVNLTFSSKTLSIQVPDWSYTEEEKQKLRDFYLLKYVVVLKESQLRANVLLWKTFSLEEQERILSLNK